MLGWGLGSVRVGGEVQDEPMEAQDVLLMDAAPRKHANTDDENYRRPWTAEEDATLKGLVQFHGARMWTDIAKSMPCRSGKQCRERWNNQLADGLTKQAWTEEEDRALLEAQMHMGNQWATIAKMLPGKSDNSVKNRWHSVTHRNFRLSRGWVETAPVQPAPAASKAAKPPKEGKRGAAAAAAASQPTAPKRARGRPRRHPLADAADSVSPNTASPPTPTMHRDAPLPPAWGGVPPTRDVPHAGSPLSPARAAAAAARRASGAAPSPAAPPEITEVVWGAHALALSPAAPASPFSPYALLLRAEQSQAAARWPVAPQDVPLHEAAAGAEAERMLAPPLPAPSPLAPLHTLSPLRSADRGEACARWTAPCRSPPKLGRNPSWTPVCSTPPPPQPASGGGAPAEQEGDEPQEETLPRPRGLALPTGCTLGTLSVPGHADAADGVGTRDATASPSCLVAELSSSPGAASLSMWLRDM